MLNRLADTAQHIILSVGLTDFRKQIDGLVAMVVRWPGNRAKESTS